MRTLVIHPTGNRNVRAVLVSLEKAGQLAGFHSALAIGMTTRWLGYLPRSLRVELLRRRYDLADHLVHSHPWREIVRLVASRMGWRSLVVHEQGWACVDRVYAGLDRTVAVGLRAGGVVNSVYAYEDGALATFARAKELGMARVYDLPIAYWETLRRLIAEERGRLPEWAGTMGGGLTDSQAKLDRKTKELELADVVVVPSQFVADSLPEWARREKRVVISPFGSPDAAQAAGEATDGRNDGMTEHPISQSSDHPALRFPASGLQSSNLPPSTKRLRVLFAGSMGQRKGLADLMAAVRMLNRADVELVCMGSLQAPLEFYQQQCPGFTYEKGRPHAEVLKLMRSCDVFCLPSIVEGRALVMQEAMSQGLPIIITPNTGGEDLVCGADWKPETGKLKAEGEVGKLEAENRKAETGKLKPEGNEEKLETGGLKAEEGHGAEKVETGNCKAGLPEIPQVSGFRSQPSTSSQALPHRYVRSATGFLVPIRSPESIAEAIAWCADHREEVAAMGRAAQAKAAQYTWEAYGDRIVEAIREEVAKRVGKAEGGKLKVEG